MRQLACVVFLSASMLAARDQIGSIDFYGYKGIDVEAVRRTLPFRTGDAYTAQIKPQARETVERVIGRPPTDVEAICCDQNGDRLIFIGLPGQSSRPFLYSAAPTGPVRLSPELWDLQKQIEAAQHAAVSAGRSEEDHSEGYALSKNDPDWRTLQLRLRAYVLLHEKEVYAVLESSSNNQNRQYAANALGYGRQSPEQTAALVAASRDPNDGVRDEAVRALWCLATKPEMRKLVPPDPFVGMMNSGVWTDRNKASLVLAALTESREPSLLMRLRAEALDAIIEMAPWHDKGRALAGVSIFAHLAGAPEEKVLDAANRSVEAMLALLPGR